MTDARMRRTQKQDRPQERTGMSEWGYAANEHALP